MYKFSAKDFLLRQSFINNMFLPEASGKKFAVIFTFIYSHAIIDANAFSGL
jgi:hypothetical protein